VTSGESVPLAAERTPGGTSKGPLLAIGAGVTFGTLGIFGTLFYEHGGGEFPLLVFRFCGASVVLIGIALLRRVRLPARRDLLLAGLAGLGQLGATACLFAGYHDASPGLVTLLFYVYPLLVTIGDRVLFGVVLGRTRSLVLLAGLAGIALTVGSPESASAGGVLWGLAAGVLTTGYILLSRHVLGRTADPLQLVAVAYTWAALAVLVVALFVGLDWPPADALPAAAGVILVGSVVPVLLFYSAIQLSGAGTAARLATVEPVTSVVLSYVVLGDSLTATQIVGGAIVVASVVALARS
jgi:drug/metabolite transporter (DMT)-like permease